MFIEIDSRQCDLFSLVRMLEEGARSEAKGEREYF